MTEEQLLALSDYATSDLFTEAEKAAFELADAMTREPVEVSDAQFARWQAHFSDAELVELAAHVGLANIRSRLNGLFHVQAHGFCHLPLPTHASH